MLPGYEDIIEAAGAQRPLWWDQNGVPRFRSHHPNLASDIYAEQVVLLRIACQSCLHEQLVQMTWGPGDALRSLIRDEWAALRKGERFDAEAPARSLADAVRDGTLHYGDPPHHAVGDSGDFCHAGCTMSAWSLRVEEFWKRADWDWGRVSELEVVMPDGKPCAGCAAPSPECACVGGPVRVDDEENVG